MFGPHQSQTFRLPPRPLMLVYDLDRAARCAGGNPLAAINSLGALVQGGVDMIQLRAPTLPGDALFVVAEEMRTTVGRQALLLLNCGRNAVLEDVVRVALTVGADGLHLSENGPRIDDVRWAYGPTAPVPVLGRSVHSAEAARAATAEGADYLVVGSIYATASHPGSTPAGTALLRAVRAATSLPLLAIGGITAERADAVREAGADGVAVFGAILDADSPDEAARTLRAVLTRGPTAKTRQR